MQFSAMLDSSYQRRDAAAILRLAASTEGKDLWHLGREGPFDGPSLQIQALGFAEHWLLDEQGVLRSEIVSRLGNLTDAEQSLVQYLSVNPAETQAMMQLLSNRDPSVRWIGLEKTRFLPDASQAIVQTVRNIAERDDYIVLKESATEREFRAPLRILANTRLQQWGVEEIHEDKSALARAGLKNLMEDYSDHPDRRLIILSAVSGFNSVFTPIARRELERLHVDTAEEQQALNAFRQSIKKP